MQIRLYHNLKDDFHCFQACLKMVLDYFGENYSFKRLDKITGFKKDKLTWSTKGLLYLSQNGYDIIDVCNFDFKRFAREGEKYLKWYYSPDAYKYQNEYSNFISEQKLIKKALDSKIKLVNKKNINIKLETKKYPDYAIIVSVNNFILNKEKGYDSHLVVVTKISSNYVFLNDPGLPARKRKVPLKLFNKALNDEFILIKKK